MPRVLLLLALATALSLAPCGSAWADPDHDDYDSDGDGWDDEEDCEPFDEDIHPEADEVCDGEDTDCDGIIPEDERDRDSDFHLGCEGDCDDRDPRVHPGADEGCDGVDSDCDGDLPPQEFDADEDGWSLCEGDCADNDRRFNPRAREICDGEDNNCDTRVPNRELDDDCDGYLECDVWEGGDRVPLSAAECQLDDPDYRVLGGGDCEDGSAAAYPGGHELCDLLDNDCDGLVDDDCGLPPSAGPSCLTGCGLTFDAQASARRSLPGNAVLVGLLVVLLPIRRRRNPSARLPKSAHRD